MLQCMLEFRSSRLKVSASLQVFGREVQLELGWRLCVGLVHGPWGPYPEEGVCRVDGI